MKKNSSMELREATLDDVPGILRVRRFALENELRKPLDEQSLAKALRKGCKAYVAVEREEILAFVLACKKTKSIWGLFVLEPFQGQGLGRGLLDLAIAWLRQQRYGILRTKLKAITLSTRQGAKAEAFYQHCGWERGKLLEHEEVEYIFKLR